MGFRVGLNIVKNLFKKSSYKPIAISSQKMTRSMTDSSSGIIKLEREINRNGKEALAVLEKFPDGKTQMVITSGGDNLIGRTKVIQREPNASIWGGPKTTIEKKYTKYWCHTQNTKLIKEYNKDGILEHKELTYTKNVGNEYYTNHKAVQDRVYDEYALNNSIDNMLAPPSKNKYIKHSLDNDNNYYYFADGGSTKYTREIAVQKQAAVDAAKKAEQAAIIAKEAAEKAAAELRTKQPRINLGKALNKNIDELKSVEKQLPDGTIERTFTDTTTGKIVAITNDKGILHKEWIYGGKADIIFMKQIGTDAPYIVAQKGRYTQINTKNGKKYTLSQYYTDGGSSLERYAGMNELYLAKGYVKVYDETAAQHRLVNPGSANLYPDYVKVRIWQGKVVSNDYNVYSNAHIKANKYIKELNADAKQNFIDLNDLYSNYKP